VGAVGDRVGAAAAGDGDVGIFEGSWCQAGCVAGISLVWIPR